MNTIILVLLNKIFSGYILLVILTCFCIAGLWPFNFLPENKVKWLSKTNGIFVYGQGIVYTPDMLNSENQLFKNESMTVEMLLQPRIECDCFIARILSQYDGHKSENFYIGQWKDELIIGSHFITTGNGENHNEVGLENILVKDKKVFLTITSGSNGTTVYINGKQYSSFPQLKLLHNTNTSGYLIIGNSPTGKHYWIGELYGLAMYNKILRPDQVLNNYFSWTKNNSPITAGDENPFALYLFNEKSGNTVVNHTGKEALIIPIKFTTLRKVILEPPWENFKFDRSYVKDITLNFFGFIPFGFSFLALLWKPRRFKNLQTSILVIVTGAGISLIIELLQVNLPTRSSSLTDLILNTLGTATGVIIFTIISNELTVT